MSDNEFSIKPTANLKIDKSKETKSFKSIMTEVNKMKNSTITIIQNQDISDKEKYLTLWEQNNKLHEIINSLNFKLLELERKREIYQIFKLNSYKENADPELFWKLLAQDGIKFKKDLEIKVKPTQKSVIYGSSFQYEHIYRVLAEDVVKFLELADFAGIVFI